jgi:DNA-binding transcriptional LysR family regulator
VSLLERGVGVQLVLRTRRGVVPTEAGRLLLEHAEVILGRAVLAERQLGELAGLRRGEVWLGSFFTALVYLSAEVGARLDARHPDLVLRDELVDRRTAFRRLASGELDVAVVFEPVFEPDPPPGEVEVVPLFVDPLRVLLPAGHALAGRRAIPLAHLAGETWIRPHEGSAARLLDHVLAEHGLARPLLAAGRGDEAAEAQALVAAGKGVILAYELNVIISPESIVARPLRDPLPGRRVQAALMRDQRGPGTLAVLDILLEIARERARS